MSTTKIKEFYEFINSKQSEFSIATIRSYQKSIDNFLIFFDNIQCLDDLKNLKRVDFRKYKESLMSGLSESSVNAYLRPLSSLFNWIYDNEMIDINLSDKIEYAKERTKLVEIPTREEYQKLLNACLTVEERVLVRLMGEMGLRRHELTLIKKSDVFEGRLLIHGKGKKEVKLLIKPDLLNEIYEVCNSQSQSEYLFVSSQYHTKLTPQSIYNRLIKISKRTDVSSDRFDILHRCHMLRHRCVTSIYQNTKNLKIAQSVARHASSTTTQKVYLHAESFEIDNALMLV